MLIEAVIPFSGRNDQAKANMGVPEQCLVDMWQCRYDFNSGQFLNLPHFTSTHRWGFNWNGITHLKCRLRTLHTMDGHGRLAAVVGFVGTAGQLLIDKATTK